MKKSVLALALAFGVTTAFAQDLTSKKGEPILPEAGDWGLGIDASPILGYAKTFIGTSNGQNNLGWNFLTSNQTISGRYFADEKTVYRGAVRLGFGSTTHTSLVKQDLQSDPNVKVTDTWKHSYSGVGLSGGIEMRKGKTRLQGYYGGEVGIWFGGGSDKVTYGNAISSSNTAPTRTDFSASYGPSAPGAGVTAAKQGSTFQFGLRGFIGAEYFILPKMSIGGEFGWGLAFSSTGQGETTTESWDPIKSAVQTTTSKTGKTSTFSLDTDAMNTVFGSSASIRWNLYF